MVGQWHSIYTPRLCVTIDIESFVSVLPGDAFDDRFSVPAMLLLVDAIINYVTLKSLASLAAILSINQDLHTTTRELQTWLCRGTILRPSPSPVVRPPSDKTMGSLLIESTQLNRLKPSGNYIYHPLCNFKNCMLPHVLMNLMIFTSTHYLCCSIWCVT